MAIYDFAHQHSDCPICMGRLTVTQCDQLLFTTDVDETNWVTVRRR